MAAWSYSKAMKMIVEEVDAPGKHHLSAPFTLLSGFALELGLKSALAAGGENNIALRRIGHSLTGAMEAALKIGLRPERPAELRRVVELLDPPHVKLQMRYIPADIDAIPLPGPNAAMQAVDDLLEAVWTQFPKVQMEMPGRTEDGCHQSQSITGTPVPPSR